MPKKYRRNSIKGDPHCSKKVAADFQKEVSSVGKKFPKADYPIKLINSVIYKFCDETEKILYIIP